MKKKDIKIEKLEGDRNMRELQTRRAHERLAPEIRALFGSC